MKQQPADIQYPAVIAGLTRNLVNVQQMLNSIQHDRFFVSILNLMQHDTAL